MLKSACPHTPLFAALQAHLHLEAAHPRRAAARSAAAAAATRLQAAAAARTAPAAGCGARPAPASAPHGSAARPPARPPAPRSPSPARHMRLATSSPPVHVTVMGKRALARGWSPGAAGVLRMLPQHLTVLLCRRQPCRQHLTSKPWKHGLPVARPLLVSAQRHAIQVLTGVFLHCETVLFRQHSLLCARVVNLFQTGL